MNHLNHVAIIMDGNGRWGVKNRNSRNQGHKEGLKVAEKVIFASIEKNIKFLTLFAFSTENWKRPKEEIDYLFNLLERFLNKKISYLLKNNIKLKIIGKKNFNKNLNYLLKNVEQKTKKNNKIQVNLALNYGSRDEIVNSFKKLKKKKLDINEKNISNNLYTKNIPDPEILIRTGKTHRLSNFLLWQLSYTEIFFINSLWPDFTKTKFLKILKTYNNLKRNFGSI